VYVYLQQDLKNKPFKMKFLALLLFPVFSFGQTKPNQTISLINDKIELLAPKALTKMSDEIWTLKYHTLPRPLLVLTDENGEVNLLADLTQQPLTESQMAAYQDFRLTNLKKTRTDIKILDQGIKTVDGKHIGFIKFLSQASDQKIFNFFSFCIVNGKLMQFTFNCTETLQKNWEKVADEMVNSIKIK
jgi:hypothetical protein